MTSTWNSVKRYLFLISQLQFAWLLSDGKCATHWRGPHDISDTSVKCIFFCCCFQMAACSSIECKWHACRADLPWITFPCRGLYQMWSAFLLNLLHTLHFHQDVLVSAYELLPIVTAVLYKLSSAFSILFDCSAYHQEVSLLIIILFENAQHCELPSFFCSQMYLLVIRR